MGEVEAIMHKESGGVATILAIGTANPFHTVIQAHYPDFYFRVTHSQDKTMLKHKFHRICENSMIKRRQVHMTEETLKQNPNLCTYDGHPSFNARQDIVIAETPKLAERAAAAAIEEWGRPKSDITHLIIHSTSGVDMPSADIKLVNSLGLSRSVRRLMLYSIGCFAGATVLRLAKDIAENDPSARVLAVCVEVLAEAAFRGPSDADMACLVGQAIFGDGAAAVVVASDAGLISGEAPVFRVVAASETLIPGTEEAITAHCREEGLTFYVSPEVPRIIGENVEACLAEAFEPLGVARGGDWNSLFWALHPGGAAILREIEARVGLEKEKLRATWHVLKEYGNMSSCTVFFVLDEMRKWSAKEGKSTTGEGMEWGVLFGFGTGVTIETVVLQSVPIKTLHN